ncbi:SPASM domain-containing protein [Noviherbaspirillum aridicola]|uniref:Radical SAM protein n=1 Tax=Noviherbaspirillum aridicola TaxID=2849687 RepID=A0ABQ4Q972_9BURK|nr:SPASM domain-containing protein [Noviherbaspirillum aridicola]GIZ53753.1 radical SAM protein [Noviherbaspirillum aridicola]
MTAAVPLPRYLQIEPVGQCNLRCRMCPIQFRADGQPGQPRAFIDFDLFCRLVDQFPADSELQLQGLGEPLLHPRFFDMVRYAAKRGMQVSTNTNMTVMTGHGAAECIDSGLHTLHVSLDGATAGTYQEIRLRARFERVLRNLRRVVAARAQAGSATPHLRLVAVAMRRNLEELPALVTLAHDEGISTIFVQHLCHDFGESTLPARYAPMRDFVDAQTLLNEDPARVAHYFGLARAEARRLGMDLRLPSLRPRAHDAGVSGRTRCDWPWRGAYISYDGRAMPCCMVATPDRIHFGDMAQYGVEQVWNNQSYSAFREQLEHGPAPEVCQSCALYSGTF